jgi:hypothetical protein
VQHARIVGGELWSCPASIEQRLAPDHPALSARSDARIGTRVVVISGAEPTGHGCLAA